MASVVRSVAIVASILLPVDAGLTKMTLFNKLAVHATVAEIPPDQAAARTMLTLDVNQDGRVDSSEVAAFAKTQGYDAAPTTAEFMGLDANHDGSLDVTELSNALSLPPPASAPATPVVEIPAQLKATPVQVQPVQMTALSEVEPVQVVASVAQPAQAGEIPATQNSLLGQTMPQVSAAEPDAQAAAALIARELSIQATKETDARFLDRKAAELRANSTALTRQTVQRVMEAGSKAATSKTAQLLQTLTKIEDQAEEAEVQAAALRAKSKAELEQASDFMAIANAALGTSNQGA